MPLSVLELCDIAVNMAGPPTGKPSAMRARRRLLVAEGLKVERGSDSDPERRDILSRGSEGEDGGGSGGGGERRGTEGKMEKQTIKPRQEEEKPKERQDKVREKKT